jgi:hypothetical protein
MGTLRQFRPMRSSPLLQQAIFWPLPQTAWLDLESTSTLVFLSDAPPWGAAKATAATEAMRRDLKKAILVDWVGLVGKGWEASVVLEWID